MVNASITLACLKGVLVTVLIPLVEDMHNNRFLVERLIYYNGQGVLCSFSKVLSRIWIELIVGFFFWLILRFGELIHSPSGYQHDGEKQIRDDK